jgi:hypothetical protein
MDDEIVNDPKSNEQIILAIEKYFSLIMLEFKEHIQKYNNMFTDMCTNTNAHFKIFDSMIKDYSNEIQLNQDAMYEMLSKFNIINEELPKLADLYSKVKEMRIGIEKLHKEMLKKHSSEQHK